MSPRTFLAFATILGLLAVALQARAEFRETKLVPPDGAERDLFGFDLALEPGHLAASAPFADGNEQDAGAVYLFDQVDGAWTLHRKLFASDGRQGQQYGYAVVFDGDTLAVGAPGIGDPGAVYVLERDDDDWVEHSRLTASDPEAGAEFGVSVALHGDVLVAGAWFDDSNGPDSGSAYVFRRTGGVWAEEAKLVPSDGAPDDWFGAKVAVHEDTIVVGSIFDDYTGFAGAGAAYVFEYDGSAWVERQKINRVGNEDLFGWPVVLDGQTLMIGAPWGWGIPGSFDGAAIVFERSSGSWNRSQRMTSPMPSGDGEFGWAIALSGTSAAVSAVGENTSGLSRAGAVYLFQREDSTWEPSGRLTHSDPAAGDNFGDSLAMLGPVIVVGAPWADPNGPASGSVYVYEPATAPVADAGIDTQAECASPAGAVVTLDGSGSTDPDGDIERFEWFTGFGTPAKTLIAESEVVDVTLPLGVHTVTLRVTDQTGQIDTDEVVKTIVDTTPPMLGVTLNPGLLWPPNHRMVDVTAIVTSADLCGPTAVVLTSIESSEEDDAVGRSDGRTNGDVQGAEINTPDVEFSLRAERDGSGPGRWYTVVYTAVDGAGLSVAASAQASVPHNRNGRTEPVLITVGLGTDKTSLSWTEVEGALNYNVIRRTLSSIHADESGIDLGSGPCLLAGSTTPGAFILIEPEVPHSGEVFAYMVEYEDGTGLSAYGTESAAQPRLTPAGCLP